MKWLSRILSLFTCIITLGAIYLNWAEFLMGYDATNYNFVVSTVFILWWLLFSLYWGIKQEKKYIFFILIYWGINFISFIMIGSNPPGNTSILIPFSIWYGGPLYGFQYLESNLSNLFLIIAPLGLIISIIGYLIGLMMSKIKKVINSSGQNL